MEVDIEIIKSLKALKSTLPVEDFNKLLINYGITNTNFENRISGLEFEYEFLYSLIICDLCKSVIPIEEKFTTVIGEYSCDAIVKLNNDKSIMIEVKSTNEDKYSISKGNFDKRVQWAKDNGYELFFAINIFNYWTLFSTDQLVKWNRKVDISRLKYSLLSTTLGVDYYIAKNIKFVTTYTNVVLCRDLGIYDKRTNFRSRMEEFYVNNKLVKTISLNNANEVALILLSEAIRMRCDRSDTQIINNEFISTFELKETNIISIFELFKAGITQMEGASNEEKYENFIRMRNNGNINNVKDWLSYLINLLKIRKMIMIPAPEK